MNDIRINGKGNFSSGSYDTVVINGAAQCDGGFTAVSVKTNGSFKCMGEIETGLLSVNGAVRTEGCIQAERVKVDGRLKCTGDLRAQEIDCDGSAEVRGSVSAKTMDVDGIINITGNLEAAEVKCDGSIRCGGQISADLLEANGFINAEEVVGERIVIHSQMSGLVLLFPSLTSKADLIEATSIELKGVKARVINGHDIVIGPGCTIEALDCSGTLSIDPMSQVNSITGSHIRTDLG